MRVCLGVDKLSVYPHLIGRPPDAAFQHVAHASSRPICFVSTALFLYVNAVLREITSMPAIRDSSVVRSSVIPSAKYCCSGSPLMLANGNTTIDNRGAATGTGCEAPDGTFAGNAPAKPSARSA